VVVEGKEDDEVEERIAAVEQDHGDQLVEVGLFQVLVN
jgi:hypothetical protein